MHYLISKCGIANLPLFFGRILHAKKQLRNQTFTRMLRFLHTSCLEENVYRFATRKSFPYEDKKGSKTPWKLLPVIFESPTETGAVAEMSINSRYFTVENVLFLLCRENLEMAQLI